MKYLIIVFLMFTASCNVNFQLSKSHYKLYQTKIIDGETYDVNINVELREENKKELKVNSKILITKNDRKYEILDNSDIENIFLSMNSSESITLDFNIKDTSYMTLIINSSINNEVNKLDSFLIDLSKYEYQPLNSTF